MTVEPIKIEGLNQFVRELKSFDKNLPKAVRLAFNEAAQLVVDDARPEVPRGLTGRAQKSVKARSTQTRARVKGGGNSAPYYPWLDFGGSVGVNRRIRRPFEPNGRFIYKSYFDIKATGEIEDVMIKALMKVATSAGIGVSRGL